MGEILFLAHRVPYPPDRGDKMRSYHLVRALAALAPVHLVAFAEDEAERAEAAPLLAQCASHHVVLRRRSQVAAGLHALATRRPVSLCVFGDTGLSAHVRTLLAERPIAAIFGYSGQMAQYVPPDAAPRFIMDFVDVDSAKFAGYAAGQWGPMAWVHRREAWLLARFEAKTARRAALSLFVSEVEATLFRARAGLPAERVVALENGIDVERYDPAGGHVLPDLAGPLIVFTGQMDYRPNVEAVVRFARDTMPMVRARRPDARFVIVGRRPDAAVRRLDELPGVIVTGEVPDVRGWIAAAAVVVAPLGMARGVQNKVLEAMAMAKAVVASPAAAEGIAASAGAELIVADGSAAEAEAVVALINDRALALEIGAAARARMIARYGWPARLARLPEIVGLAADRAAA